MSVRELHYSQGTSGNSFMVGREHNRWDLWSFESQHLQRNLGQLLQLKWHMRFRSVRLWTRMVSSAISSRARWPYIPIAARSTIQHQEQRQLKYHGC